jgi:ERF superfamily
MKFSTSIAALASALAKAQGALEGAKKDTANPFYKSRYADLSSVVDAIKAAFPPNGLSYVQTIVTTEHGVGVETILMHESGEWIGGDAFAIPVNKADAQGFGSALTYARRYSLSAICGVKAEDDDGNAAVAARPISGAQVAKDALDAMGDEAKAYITDYAEQVKALYSSNGDVMGYLQAHTLDAEEKLALWSLLPSNIRSAIKKAQAETRSAA